MNTENNCKIKIKIAKVRMALGSISKEGQAQIGIAKYKYLTLDSIYEALLPIEKEIGLVRYQSAEIIEIGGRLINRTTTSFIDADTGYSMDVKYDIPVLIEVQLNKDGKPRSTEMQAFGSFLSYAQRYVIKCIYGIASGEDDEQVLIDRANNTQKPAPKKEERFYVDLKSEKVTNYLQVQLQAGKSPSAIVGSMIDVKKCGMQNTDEVLDWLNNNIPVVKLEVLKPDAIVPSREEMVKDYQEGGTEEVIKPAPVDIFDKNNDNW